MKFKFQILGSSSGGNCAVLTSDSATVLIDAGFSGKKIKDGLKTLGIPLDRVDAVFFTHEHSDHTAGVPGLSGAENLRFFANRPTAREIERRYKRSLAWNFFNSGESFEFRDLRITTFAILHDSAEAVGYAFETRGEKFVWLTDCGKITHNVRANLAGTAALAIESNFDPELLNRSSRPEYLKSRIRGSHGHLSNEQCAEFLEEFDAARAEHVFLAHVSRECNSRERVAETSLAAVRNRCGNAVIVEPTAFLQADAGSGF